MGWCFTLMQLTGTNRMEVYLQLLALNCQWPLQFLTATFSSCADFDEKCSKEDDWDVDMSGYYGSGRLMKSYSPPCMGYTWLMKSVCSVIMKNHCMI